jgi:hypothetical protein
MLVRNKTPSVSPPPPTHTHTHTHTAVWVQALRKCVDVRVECDVSQTGLRRTPEFRKRGVRRSERRKCVMTEEFYWPSQIYRLRIAARVAQFDTNHSVTESTQSIAASVPEAS